MVRVDFFDLEVLMYTALTFEDFRRQLTLPLILLVIVFLISVLFMVGAIPELNPTIHSDRVLGAYLFGGALISSPLFLCQGGG